MRFGKASIQTKILIAILLVALIVAIIGIIGRVQATKTERDALTDEVQKLTQSNAALSEEIENSDDEDRIAAVARDKLGLVTSGEIIFEDGNTED